MPLSPPADLFGEQGIIVLVVVALVLFGSTQIPKLARSLGLRPEGVQEGSRRGGVRRKGSPQATPAESRGRSGEPAGPGRKDLRTAATAPRPDHTCRADRTVGRAMSAGPAGSGAEPAPSRRWIPFWVLQVAELAVAFVFVDVAVHLTSQGSLLAAAALLRAAGGHRTRASRDRADLPETAPRGARWSSPRWRSRSPRSFRSSARTSSGSSSSSSVPSG